MSVIASLFPVANRTAAGVAFIRTSWQTAQATAVLSVAGGIVVTANDLATIDWRTVGLTVAAIGLTSLLAGARSAGDILVHGLPTAYSAPADGAHEA